MSSIVDDYYGYQGNLDKYNFLNYFRASDRLQEGKSTFLVEMEETGDIVKEATN